MMHAGGKMFSVPYLVAQATSDGAEAVTGNNRKENAHNLAEMRAGMRDLKSIAIILSKAFGAEASVPFALHHPSVIPTLLRNHKQRKEKRKAATLLSKLKADFLKEVISH
jgi:hypothetical protein